MRRVDVVEAALDVKEKGGDFKIQALEETDLMGEGSGGVEGREARERAGLVGVEKATGPGKQGEARGGDPFHNFGECV